MAENTGYLRYCSKHKHWYYHHYGCQFCYLEQAENKPENNSEIQMVKCPKCFKISLAWIESNNRYECMNAKCKNVFSKEEYESRIQEWEKLLKEEPKGKAWFGNSYFDPKKKKWKKAH